MPATLVPPEIMATIRARKKADGTVSYTVQIRLKKKGVLVYQEDRTFARKQAAQGWGKRRETELAEPGAGFAGAGGLCPMAYEPLRQWHQTVESWP